MREREREREREEREVSEKRQQKKTGRIHLQRAEGRPNLKEDERLTPQDLPRASATGERDTDNQMGKHPKTRTKAKNQFEKDR